MNNTIKTIAAEIQDELVKIRRDLHSHPELGLQENRTSDIVAAKLKEIGLEVDRDCYATGVVGLLRGAGEGKTVLIRADMDALPLCELNDHGYVSKYEGKMHACGHDAHTTWLLGTAMILSRIRDKINGNVKFMFQPAEEAPGGAEHMVANAVLENPKVDISFGAHVLPDIDAGVYLMQDGPVTSNPDFFDIVIQGKGAHGSTPHDSIDPIAMGVSVYDELQKFISRKVDIYNPMVLSVCIFNAGTARGIIPDSCRIAGTVRSFLPQQRVMAKKYIEDCVRHTTELYGGSYTFEYIDNAFPVVNNPDLTEKVRGYTVKFLGKDSVISDYRKFMGGEDYCFVAREVPSTFMFVGCKNEDKFKSYPLHNPRFDIDEDILSTTAAVFSNAVVSYLNEK